MKSDDLGLEVNDACLLSGMSEAHSIASIFCVRGNKMQTQKKSANTANCKGERASEQRQDENESSSRDVSELGSTRAGNLTRLELDSKFLSSICAI